MKRSTFVLTTVAIGFTLSVTPAFAQRGGGGAGGRPTGAPSTPGADRSRSSGPATEGSQKSSTSGGQKTPSELLKQNTKLASKLKTLLGGKDPQVACMGFKNLGQCVAAAHVANNHPGISFDDLKAKMTGTGSVSLGKAIQGLDPHANAKSEAKKANQQAKTDIEGTSS